jgi:hypothetical protein
VRVKICTEKIRVMGPPAKLDGRHHSALAQVLTGNREVT